MLGSFLVKIAAVCFEQRTHANTPSKRCARTGGLKAIIFSFQLFSQL